MKKSYIIIPLLLNLCTMVYGQMYKPTSPEQAKIDSTKLSKSAAIKNATKNPLLMDLHLDTVHAKIKVRQSGNIQSAISDFHSQKRLWEFVEYAAEMFKAEYKIDDMLSAVIANYHPDINEAGLILFEGYFQVMGSKDSSDWITVFSDKITSAFHTAEMSPQQFVMNFCKNELTNCTTNCLLERWYKYRFTHLASSHTDTETKNNFFQMLSKAGFSAGEIYRNLRICLMVRPSIDDGLILWTSFFSAGMKLNSVPPGEVVKAILHDLYPTRQQVTNYLKDAGYTPSEVMEGLTYFK